MSRSSVVEVRACGNSGLNLSALGLGCWAFGGGDYWGPQRQSDVDEVVHGALDAGVTYFDTAEAYNDGASESSLGLALKGEGRRARAVIGTKVSPHNTTPTALRSHCEASLQRLQTDFIDLYMVHWPLNANALRHYTSDAALLARPPGVAEAFAALADLRREGKIRHVGVSNFGVDQLTEALELGAPIAANQLPYGLLTRGIELQILPLCGRNGIGVIGYMALLQGLLSGKFASADEIPSARTRTRHFAGSRAGSRHGEAGLENETWTALQTIAKVAALAQLSMADLAIAWSMANPDVTCTLVGCRDVEQLDENLEAATKRLSPEVMAHLNHATADVLEKLGPQIDIFQGAVDSRTF